MRLDLAYQSIIGLIQVKEINLEQSHFVQLPNWLINMSHRLINQPTKQLSTTNLSMKIQDKYAKKLSLEVN